MTDIKKDELLDVYHAAAREDSFAPPQRVRGAVLMYARTLAEHRSAFPGSVAHRNEDEELELSSVPREHASLDPRPLPVKPLHEAQHDSWPRELPPVAAASPWASLSRWLGTAVVGGLALGAGYSWFSSINKPGPAPEPMIAQAPAAAPIPVPAPVPAPNVEKARDAVVAEAKPDSAAATATAKNATPAKKAKPPPSKPAIPAESQIAAVEAKRQSLPSAFPAGAAANPPVVVADGKAVASPQVTARSLSEPAASSPTAIAAAPAVIAAAPAARAAAPMAKAEVANDSAANNNAPANVAKPPVNRAEFEADPQKWLAYIEDLRSRGRWREVASEQSRFKTRYPQLNVGTPNTTQPLPGNISPQTTPNPTQ